MKNDAATYLNNVYYYKYHLLSFSAELSIYFSDMSNTQMPCTSAERYYRFRGHSTSVFRHRILWNVGIYLPNYTTSHP
jgi:hypothetical protein